MFVWRTKVFFFHFFGDLELILNIWNFMFLFMVVIIRTRVLLFSFSYIASLQVRNFLLLYLSFVFRMVWLVLRGNFYWLMLGWDGLGVVSFILIVFYINHERINNGLFTIFQNRLGDIFFIMFIVGFLNLEIQINLVLKYGIIFLFLGSVVKRAQFPFNRWLLAAIRAPTPISSLVHSSTLVVAGVYIILQFRYCFGEELYFLKYLSLLTLFWRSFGLLNEVDIKKLIAYSTINHVALIVYILRIELYKIVYFHLNIHAIFKSLIFICFGFVILISFHGQDKRLIRLIRLNPLIKVFYYFSCLCLAGLPIIRGFFSKDFIIEKFIISVNEIIWRFLLIIFLSLRVYYRLKLMKLGNVLFTFQIIEVHRLGWVSVGVIRVVSLICINLFLSLLYRISLEFLSIKLVVYLGVVFFFFLGLRNNFFLKLVVFDKMKNFKEIWIVNYYALDQYIYWNFILCYIAIGEWKKIKLILGVNWWIIVLFLIIW